LKIAGPITLAADQYLQTEVAQRGVNVIVSVFDPTGKNRLKPTTKEVSKVRN
jgi:hypothetical protein